MNSWTSCHTAFFLDCAVKHYFISLSSLMCLSLVLSPTSFLVSFRHFVNNVNIHQWFMFLFFSRLRVETHCDIVNLWQELAQNQALSSWSVECLVSSTNNERSICKSHWVHSKMNDFNNNKTFLNWKVTEWTRLTRLGRLTFRELVNLIRFAFRVKSNQQGSWWTSRKGWISG